MLIFVVIMLLEVLCNEDGGVGVVVEFLDLFGACVVGEFGVC